MSPDVAMYWLRSVTMNPRASKACRSGLGPGIDESTNPPRPTRRSAASAGRTGSAPGRMTRRSTARASDPWRARP